MEEYMTIAEWLVTEGHVKPDNDVLQVINLATNLYRSASALCGIRGRSISVYGNSTEFPVTILQDAFVLLGRLVGDDNG